MPNKENLRLWVAALRSGQYEQGQNRLGTHYGDEPSRYCCLEIANMVAAENGVELREKSLDNCCIDHDQHSTGHLKHRVTGYGRSGMPYYNTTRMEMPTRDWLGIDDLNPSLGEFSCIAANDEKCLGFNEIADLIESHYELLEEDTDGE